MNNQVSVANSGKRLLSSIFESINANFALKMALGVASAVPLAFTSIAEAAQVQIVPSSPKLGETISVLVTPDNPENSQNLQVTSDGETYPVFEVAPNQYRAFIPTTPLQKSGRRVIRVSGDGTTRNLAVWVNNRKFPVQRISLPPGKAGVKATQYELDRAKAFKAILTPEKYWNGAFTRPNNSRVSTIYGVRRYYNGKFANDYYHRGLDYAGGTGSPVVAPAAGRVTLVGTVSQGFRVHGNTVGIDHGQGVTSIFLHLNNINVKEGDMVKQGQLIGGIGSTGASTGPHLHWGLYVNGQSIDPSTWLSGEIK
ncbi:MAG: M23 family metallopeptidase [Richelia sp. RM2_1_2]|nr:M23 family metallopeptidase [Richelia sp. SM2_1_7]NJM20659.1 M23 family metallopeptidase [Richelia sp. SM1_7_0]NJN09140.1 M23 family metallopeptidase [Richelia sp. RM1_1_1]NJO28683.1 M23 family metallopeptidase [Richelia sp. SL_2_1]NJO60726.1 M23 family metallopeptidase [Richelia sp. RM2_1_2]